MAVSDGKTEWAVGPIIIARSQFITHARTHGDECHINNATVNIKNYQKQLAVIFFSQWHNIKTLNKESIEEDNQHTRAEPGTFKLDR